MPLRRSTRITSLIFPTELNLNGAGGSVAGRRYIAIRRFIRRKSNKRNFLSRKEAGNPVWNEVRTEVVGHTTLQGLKAKFNTPQKGQYRAFDKCLEALIIDLLKKGVESRRNARLNPDTEEEEGAAGHGHVSRNERAVAHPQPTVQKEKPVLLIVISTTAAEPGHARQLWWVIRGNATPNKNWLVVLKHYILQECGKAAWRYSEDDEHPWQFKGILYDFQGLHGTPDPTDQIELINDDQVNAWLRLSQCHTLTVACFLHRAAVNTPDGGNPVRSNIQLVGHYDNYLTHRQFDVTKLYT